MIEFRGELADDCIFDIETDDDPTVQGGIDLIWDALPYQPPLHFGCRCLPIFVETTTDLTDYRFRARLMR